jgi:small conductance mechanosensitive channel
MDPALLEKYKNWLVNETMIFAPKILAAILTIVVGMWLVSAIIGVLRRGMEHRKVDPTLVPFLSSVIGWIMKAVVFISAASMVGIKTTSFIAILGAAGLAVGLALQGSLANFAGGVLILMFRPYRVGDSITAQGETGTVREIQIFTTTLINGQNQKIIIPNGPLANGNIKNLSSEPHVRVDTVFAITHDADVDKAKAVLREVCVGISGVLAEPAPTIEVLDIGDAVVKLVVRPYTPPATYWDVHFALMERTKKAFDAAGIAMPVPPRLVQVAPPKA